MIPIAHIQNDFTEKFGIPRQSGLAELPSLIIFAPEYRVKEAFRGLELYSHIWLIWQFSETTDQFNGKWSPTVRPPKLGGNKRMGVFATRSPFRPNPIGLSAVKLLKVDYEAENAPVLHVSGADLMNNTPIYDIKPYLPYADSHPEAVGGFALQNKNGSLTVDFPKAFLDMIPEDRQNGIISALSHDPRPSYQDDPKRVYTFGFGGLEISFKVHLQKLTVVNVTVIR